MDRRRLSISEDVLRRRFSKPPSGSQRTISSGSVKAPPPISDGDESIALIGIQSHQYGSSDEAKFSITNENEVGNQQKRLSMAEEKTLLKDEMTSMVRLAVPVVITSLLEMFPGIATTILVGRADYGEEDEDADVDGTSKSALYMTAASLATMFVNIVALSTGFGKSCDYHIMSNEYHIHVSNLFLLCFYLKQQVYWVPWILFALPPMEQTNTPKWAPTS